MNAFEQFWTALILFESCLFFGQTVIVDFPLKNLTFTPEGPLFSTANAY